MFYLSVVFLVIAFAEIKNSTNNHCKTPHESLINRSVPEISLIKALSINLHHKPRTSRANPNKFPQYFMLYLLVLANDIELNPGPRAPKYPCGVCQKAVTWKHKAICCDTCNTWFHTQCESIRDTIYDTMQNSAGLGPPLHTSSPSSQRKQHSYTHIPKTKNPLRIINLNCQSLKNKKAEFLSLIDSTKPDIIIGTESWLSNSISDTE